jgi:hypothetical protein
MRLGMSNRLAKTFHLPTISSYLDSRSNLFIAFAKLSKPYQKSLVPHHFTLKKGELFRVPSGSKELHVLSGKAWITVAGEDIILNSGEKASLASNQGFAILSALGNMPLILEVF